MMRRHSGFTLFEILAALVIMGILTGLAAPSFNDLIARQRVRNTAASIQLALLQARYEAAKRGVAVAVVPVAGGWNDGWQVIVPLNPDPLVISEDRPTKAVEIVAGGGAPVFLPSGRLRGNARPTFRVESSLDDEVFSCLITNATGKPKSSEGPC